MTAAASTNGETMSPTVQDHVDVGTANILSSPHVSQGPGRIANAPVPSVFSDDRGDMHRLRVGHTTHQQSLASPLTSKTTISRGTRINLSYSTANVMRSGYLHPIPKRGFVLRGKVEVWTLTQTETLKTIHDANTTFEIEAYVPHILHFLEETVLIEWWWWPEDEQKRDVIQEEENEEDEEEKHESTTTTLDNNKHTTGGDLPCWYYHPYRRIVDIHNSLVAPSAGRFQRLVPQDSYIGDSSAAAWPLSDWTIFSSGSSLGNALWWSTGFMVGTAVATAVCIMALSSGHRSSHPK